MMRRAVFSPMARETERVRAFVAQVMGCWRLARRFSEDEIKLVVTELFSNAVRHAKHGGNGVEVMVSWEDGVVRVEVHDPDPRLPQMRELTGLDELSGRGLILVDALTSRWGARPKRAGGKYVFAELAELKAAGVAPEPAV